MMIRADGRTPEERAREAYDDAFDDYFENLQEKQKHLTQLGNGLRETRAAAKRDGQWRLKLSGTGWTVAFLIGMFLWAFAEIWRWYSGQTAWLTFLCFGWGMLTGILACFSAIGEEKAGL